VLFAYDALDLVGLAAAREGERERKNEESITRATNAQQVASDFQARPGSTIGVAASATRGVCVCVWVCVCR
jgi:hypothetical protein